MHSSLIHMIIFITSSIAIFSIIVSIFALIIGYNLDLIIGLISGYIIGLNVCYIVNITLNNTTYEQNLNNEYMHIDMPVELKCSFTNCVNNIYITKAYYDNIIKKNDDFHKNIRCNEHGKYVC